MNFTPMSVWLSYQNSLRGDNLEHMHGVMPDSARHTTRRRLLLPNSLTVRGLIQTSLGRLVSKIKGDPLSTPKSDGWSLHAVLQTFS